MDPRPIEHVFVLMLENRSFDHVFGHLPPDAGGPPEGWANADSHGTQYTVRARARYLGAHPDPRHGHGDVMNQTGPATDFRMHGFVKDYFGYYRPPWKPRGEAVMDCYAPPAPRGAGKIAQDCGLEGTLRVFEKLREEYCLCTRWFCSFPGLTVENRTFLLAGTTEGRVERPITDLPKHTIFEDLDAKFYNDGSGRWHGGWRPWRVYYGDVASASAFEYVLLRPGAVEHFRSFKEELDRHPVCNGKDCTYPKFIYLEPSYFWGARDAHPPHDIRYAEGFIKEVYEALLGIGKEHWQRSLLVVLFDEHGGFCDHVPPATVANPDGRTSENPPFDFTTTGPRVPALVISPLVKRGSTSEVVFDHTSILKTLQELFDLPDLGDRAKAANSLLPLLLDVPRPTPATLPAVPSQVSFWRSLMSVGLLLRDTILNLGRKRKVAAPSPGLEAAAMRADPKFDPGVAAHFNEWQAQLLGVVEHLDRLQRTTPTGPLEARAPAPAVAGPQARKIRTTKGVEVHTREVMAALRRKPGPD